MKTEMVTNVALGVAAAVVAGGAVVAGRTIRDDRLERYKMHIVTSSIYCVGALLWPVVFYFIAASSYAALRDPYIVFGFLWPLVLLMMDIAFVTQRFRRSESEEESLSNELRGSGGMLIGAAWAVGALLAVIASKKIVSPASGGEGWSETAARLVLIALLLCIAFLIPSPQHNARSYFSLQYRSAQKVMLNYAIGLFVVGVVFAWRGY